MSMTLNTMLNQKVGFRTEDFSGSNVRNLKDVVYYEIRELKNTDILDTMNELYGLDFSDCIDSEEECVYDECYWDVSEQIFSHLEKQFNTSRDNLRAIWLTTYDNVEKIFKEVAYQLYAEIKAKKLGEEKGALKEFEIGGYKNIKIANGKKENEKENKKAKFCCG